MNKPARLYLGLIPCLILVIAGPCRSSPARTRISAKPSTVYSQADIAAEVYFGRRLAARILAEYPLWQQAEANRYVNLVGRALSNFTGRSDLEFTFAILDSDQVNAFAVPGGYIFITRGLMSAITDESQLAAVLGHEIAHVVLRHIVRELHINGTGGSAVGGLASLIGGATGGVRTALEQGLDNAADILLYRGYPMEQELEADTAGLLIAASAGYDPFGLERLLTTIARFETASRTKPGDHPPLEQRLAAFYAAVAENGLNHRPNAQLKERYHEMASTHP